MGNQTSVKVKPGNQERPIKAKSETKRRTKPSYRNKKKEEEDRRGRGRGRGGGGGEEEREEEEEEEARLLARIRQGLEMINDDSSIHESGIIFRESLYDAFLTKTMTDVTVQVGYDVVSCHGLILATATNFFDKKIRIENSSYVRISHGNLNGKIFKAFLEFLYLGRFTDNIDLLLEDVLKCMKYLGLTPKFQRMFGLALSSLDPSAFLKHWGMLAKADLPEAANELFKVILKQFPRLQPDDDFLRLKCQQIADLLNSDELNVENEETVCDMALLWLSHNNGSEDEVALLFKTMRLSQVSLSYLENYIETFDLLESYPVCKGIVAEARHFHEQPGRRHDYYDKRYHFRSVSTLTETMVLFGGVRKDGTRGEMMLAFNFARRAWCSLGSVPLDFGRKFAHCTFDNDIYISGGSSVPSQVVRFVAASRRWTKVNSLNVGRTGHCMEAVDHKIYVLGGVDDEDNLISEIEELHVETGVWRVFAQLIFPLKHACSAVIKDKIYLFGGQLDPRSNNTTGLVQSFDTRKGQTTLINDMNLVLKNPRAIKCNKSVYILNSNGTIYEISEDHVTCTQIASLPDFHRKKFGLYVHHGKLLVVGGESGDIVLGDMVCFQPGLNQSIICPWSDFMPPVRSDFGIAKVVLDKSKLKEELNIKIM